MREYFHDQRRITRRQCLGALSVSAGFATVGLADPPEQGAFQSLFDGQSLDRWHTNPKRIGHGTGGSWQVEDGVLTGEQSPPGSGNGGVLLTDRTFADFELTLELNPDWGIDSGVFLRCTDRGEAFQMYVDYRNGGNVGHLRGELPDAFAMMPFRIAPESNSDGIPQAFQTQIDPRAKTWPKGVYEYSCGPDDWLNAWRVNDWNTARIRCVGKFPQITIWINGVKICHFNGETSTMPGYDKRRVFQTLGRSGSIGLQVHGGKRWPRGAKCRWRNIQIREL